MKTGMKILLIIGAVLIGIGAILFCLIMTKLDWDFRKLSTVGFENTTYNITESFQNISIKTDTADVYFVPANNSETNVLCYEEKDINHTVSVEDETLNITINDNRKWYDHINISFGKPTITIYLPGETYEKLTVTSSTSDIEIPGNFTFRSIDITGSTGDTTCAAAVKDTLKIHQSTGDIEVEHTNVGAMNLTVSTGEVSVESVKCAGDVNITVSTGDCELANLTCANLSSTGNTGDITLAHVIAINQISISRSTGSAELDSCDAGTLFIETDTGDVKGSLLSDKVFITKTSTGNINVPETTSGGTCKVTTSTGSIRFIISK